MSSPFKAIGRAFKSVVKVIKKIAVPVLIVGAIVLTGGAAIGALPALGSVLGSIGISGTMASVIGGAVSGIAVGAGTGAIGAAITGGNIWKAMKSGAITGGLTGGIMGAVGAVGPNGILGAKETLVHPDTIVSNSLKGMPGLSNTLPTVEGSITGMGQSVAGATSGAAAASSPAAAATPSVVNTPPVAPLASGPATGAAPGVNAATGNVTVPVTAAPGTGAPGGAGFAGNPGPWMMGGQVISGLGQAMVGASVAKADKDEQRRIAASYNVDPSAHLQLTPGANASLPSPSERFGSSTAYYYDAKTGRVLPKGA